MGGVMELVCPGGSLAQLNAAVNAGAGAVYMGLKNATNARHFGGLNFNERTAQKALNSVHQKGCKLYMAINTYAQQQNESQWQDAVRAAYDLGANAIIAADVGVMDFALHEFPDLDIHLSVQASATNALSLKFFKQNFNIKRAVLPRVLSLKQVDTLIKDCDVPLEVFGFGSLCIMVEGRCYLSSYLTGESPNTAGACSPAKFVQWQQEDDILESRLNNILIDQYTPDEKAGYPTLCKGRFYSGDQLYHAIEEPVSLNTLDILPQLITAGVSAVKIEGRQRSAAYVEQVVRIWRQAIDRAILEGDDFCADPHWHEALLSFSEGSLSTLGAYHRPWM
jgi:O2-independent ubiquinone biosynthesis protein UbiU